MNALKSLQTFVRFNIQNITYFNFGKCESRKKYREKMFLQN